jgi:lipopolysaccharide/colanic/teichoic acid biosynthesis glycosyltransferase
MMRPLYEGLPRPVQAAAALALLVAIAPLLCAIAIAVGLTSRGPVLFRHRRVGRGGTQFDLIKFRTMRSGANGPDVTAKADPRITAVGRILRKTKLDELPELWNVVRGDMALVGPRPEAVQYVDLSSDLWRSVLRVRPGLTDPVTLRLRNEEAVLVVAGSDYESFYRRFLLPYKLRGYQEYLSIRTATSDLAVLWLTVLAVIFPARVHPPSLEEIGYRQV